MADDPQTLDQLRSDMVGTPADDTAETEGLPEERTIIPKEAPIEREESEPADSEKKSVAEWWARTGPTPERERLERQLRRDTATIYGMNAGEQSQDEQRATEDRATVTTRHIFRNAVQSMALVMPQSPDVVIEPVSEMPVYDLQTGATSDNSDGISTIQVAFADAIQRAQKKLSIEANAWPNFRGLVQDAHHFEIVWCHVTWQSNFATDSINSERLPDIQDQLAELEVLTEAYDKDEFQDTDPEYERMEALMAAVAAQTEVPVWEGAVIKAPPPHMVGIDPKIKRPEDWRNADWIYVDYLWTRMDVLKRLKNVDPDDLMICKVYGPDGSKTAIDVRSNENVPDQQPVGTAIGTGASSDTTRRNVNDWDNLLVRVVESKRDQTVYVLVQGLDYFADRYQPQNRYADWYEIFPIVLNRGPGNDRLAGISDTELQCKEQDRLNRIDTDEDEDARAARNHGIFDKDVIEDWDGKGMSDLWANEWLGVSFGGKNMAEAFLPLPGAKADPAIHAQRRQTAQSNLRSMSGIPEQKTGALGNPKFAEQIRVADSGANDLMRYRSTILSEAINDAWRRVCHLIVVNASVDLMALLVGEAVRPIWMAKPTDRLEVLRHLSIKVVDSVGSKGSKEDTLKGLDLLMKIDAAPPGLIDKELLEKAVCKVLELPLDSDQLIKPNANDLAMRLGQQMAKNPDSLDQKVLQQLAQVLMPVIQRDIQAMADQRAAAAGVPPGAPPDATAQPAPQPPAAAPAPAMPPGAQ